MLGKIKNIKKYIKYAKIGGVIFAIIFLCMIGFLVFQQVQIHNLDNRINILEGQ